MSEHEKQDQGSDSGQPTRKSDEVDCWVSVSERLPEVEHDADGGVNCVLVWNDPRPDCGSHYDIVNVVWLRNHVKNVKPLWITHWMELPNGPIRGVQDRGPCTASK